MENLADFLNNNWTHLKSRSDIYLLHEIRIGLFSPLGIKNNYVNIQLDT